MVQSLQLGGPPDRNRPQMRRVNRVPIITGIVLILLFLGVIFYGLSSRGLYFRNRPDNGGQSGPPASSYGDQLKRGVPDGIIGEPTETQTLQPTPGPPAAADNPFAPRPGSPEAITTAPQQLEPEEIWRERLQREADEQYFHERQRERMARLQASDTAYDSPMAVSIKTIESTEKDSKDPVNGAPASRMNSAGDLYSAALKAGLGGQNLDPNRQGAKEDFFNADLRNAGYLPNKVVPQQSRYELKRGSVIPATLITGINSDLPGRITAQVSQNVFDSATGHYLLIPQGTKLVGRYDSKVAFGQSRVLVVWTDLIFPNGSTLQLEGMSGTDAKGYGGFIDKVDRHDLRTFGSAVLLAIIGTGIDMAVPQSSTLATQDTASDAARRNFAETFGRVAERTVSKNLDVQPTLRIRPGYNFNILVDQDIIFPDLSMHD